MNEPRDANNRTAAPEDNAHAAGAEGAARNDRRGKLIAVAIVVLIAALVFGVRWLAYSRNHVSTDDAQVESTIYSISSRVAGHVLKVPVDTNDSARAGQLLVEIDPTDYQVALQQAQATLAQAESSVSAASGTVELTQRTGSAGISQAAAAVEGAKRVVAAARANLVSMEARADEARKEAARMELLLANGAVSVQQRDSAVAASISARANVEGARAQVRSAQAGLEQARAALRAAETSPVQTEVRRSEVGTARGRVAEARAKVEQAKLNLGYTRITSPADGVIAKKNVEPGQFVQPGQPLFALVGDDTSHITANFKETQLKKIKVGDRATFTVDAYPGVRFTGRVESISPGTGAVFSLLPPENASGNFTKVVQRIPVRIAIDEGNNPSHPLRAGMSVVVTVETK